jgi:hypothetical protein
MAEARVDRLAFVPRLLASVDCECPESSLDGQTGALAIEGRLDVLVAPPVWALGVWDGTSAPVLPTQRPCRQGCGACCPSTDASQSEFLNVPKKLFYAFRILAVSLHQFNVPVEDHLHP